MTEDHRIAVVIPAYNAADTIGAAVVSALAQDETAEVLVVDDCSTDGTADAAERAGQGDARLRLLRQPVNQGPSAARNRAIEQSEAPYIAILDADDRLLPGRFAPMMRQTGWDLCADNILFVTQDVQIDRIGRESAGDTENATMLSLAGFVTGNMSHRHRSRAELGFLKPVISRAVLARTGARYHPDCRLGEDYLIYARLLALGARFQLMPQAGYAAFIRPDSLSGLHGAEALARLHAAERDLLSDLPVSPQEQRALERHARQTRRKLQHRRALDRRRQDGLLAGMLYAAAHPTAGIDIVKDWVSPHRDDGPVPRTLFDPADMPGD